MGSAVHAEQRADPTLRCLGASADFAWPEVAPAQATSLVGQHGIFEKQYPQEYCNCIFS